MLPALRLRRHRRRQLGEYMDLPIGIPLMTLLLSLITAATLSDLLNLIQIPGFGSHFQSHQYLPARYCHCAIVCLSRTTARLSLESPIAVSDVGPVSNIAA